MFKCAHCETSSRDGEKAVVVVLERAPIEHPEHFNRRLDRFVPGGCGTRIVREVQMHASCAAQDRGEDAAS